MPSEVRVSELDGVFVAYVKDFKPVMCNSAKLLMVSVKALSQSDFVAQTGLVFACPLVLWWL